MAHKTLIGGTAYEISGGKTLIDGTAYAINGGKTMVGGTVRNISFGTPISTLPVGTTVYLPYTYYGSRRVEPFLIIHQGLPNATSYDASCNGTWLVYKSDCLRSGGDNYWDSSSDDEDYDNDYEHSDVHGAFAYESWDIRAQSEVNKICKQVKIPYRPGKGTSKTVRSGANGLSTKLFLLSYTEVGFSGSSYAPIEGVALDFFKGITNSNRLIGVQGFLRTPYCSHSATAFLVNSSGAASNTTTENQQIYRPAFIVPSDLSVDEDFNVMA